ncbi:unnamed protein product [Brassica napus]|uniref:(rape) hypothetical protein n=1 Tax=Brassica napus TaxID=3708 RepID=A0A817AUQ6_BRANA|nr:unnamed protein product [Brassica napus]
MADWSLLPEELLNIISENVEDCFDIVHARSVSNSWRSTFSFPCMLRRQSYSLPSFANFPSESKDLCTLEKIPLFLFRVQTPPPASASEYFLGGIGRDESEDQTELPSPIQCSVKAKIPGSDPTLMNMRDGQIFPLGHQYRISCDSKEYRSLAFLPLHKEGREEFIVLLSFGRFLLALRSSEMKWELVMGFKAPSSDNIVTFRRSDLGDRVLFIRQQGNVSCSAKELPDGCGVSGNSILFTNELDNGTYVYKYGVDTGREEDDLNCWRFSGENRVTILSTSPVVNFRVEH